MTEIEDFIGDALSNSSSGRKLNGFLAPYKPALLLSVIEKYGTGMFNKDIKIEEIAERWFELCKLNKELETGMNDIGWYKSRKNKKKALVSQISKMPAFYLQRDGKDFYKFNKQDKTIRFNLKGQKIEESLKLLKSAAIIMIGKCYRDFDVYKGVDESMYQKLTDLFRRKSSNRPAGKQRIFRKEVLARYKGCVCCPSTKNLEAAHIKPFVKSCGTEEFTVNNGVTMCGNCHTAFDKGELSFDYIDDLGKVFISYCKEFMESNSWMEDKFERDIELSNESIAFAEYHYKNIFKCKDEATR